MSTPFDPWGQGVYALPPQPPPAPPRDPPPGGSGPPDGGAEADGPPRFGSAEEFVNTYLSRIVCRRLGQGTAMWCPEWWRHREAVIRLDALWRAFEYLTRDPELGMSTWWLYHADPHLRALTDPDSGPFALCDPEEGHATYPLGPLPVRPAPADVWDDPLIRGDRTAD